MGEHKGWRVRQEPRTGNWRGEVRRPGGYDIKTFPSAKEARAWASGRAAQRRTGQILAPVAAVTDRLADDYMADLRARGRAPSHLRDVALMLAAATAVCPDLASPEAPAQLDAWLANLQTTGRGRGRAGPVSPARRNKYRVMVRGLCQWAIRHDRLARDPTRAIAAAAVPDRLKPQLGVDDLRRLVAYHRRPPTWRWAMLMLYAGLRADEARCLRHEDIDRAGQVILIRQASGARLKRGHERIVHLQAELAELIPAGRGRVVPLGPGNLGRALADLLRAAGLAAEGITPHSLRHSYAGLMTATGVPTALVGAYLGHNQASTTLGYTKAAARYAAAVTGWPMGRFQLRSAAPSTPPTSTVPSSRPAERSTSDRLARPARPATARATPTTSSAPA